MKYRYLGNSGLLVSNVCLGTLTFGEKVWGTDGNTSQAILSEFFNQGGNFIDTADKYAEGRSEEIIGRWLQGEKRDSVVIGSKCFFPTSENINHRGLSRHHIISACEASLKRLKTDYIDYYQLHAPDPVTPIEETMSALDTLVQQGKVRYVGCSNFPAWLLMKAAYVAEKTHGVKFIGGQYLYNLLKRNIEQEIVPACSETGVGVICWSPLSGGMLTGKYQDPTNPPPGTRIDNRPDLSENNYCKWYKKSLPVVRAINDIAKTYGVPPAAIALAWLLHQKCVDTVVIGASSVEQIKENCVAGGLILSDSNLQKLDGISQREKGYPYDWISGVQNNWSTDID